VGGWFVAFRASSSQCNSLTATVAHSMAGFFLFI
jgi:hypothetical protein